MTRFIVAASCALLATLTPTAASATPSIYVDGQNRAYIRYHDLDLKSDQGRSQLIHRIRLAADLVCPDRDNLTSHSDFDGECYRTAVASGVSQMNEIVRR